MTSGDSRGFSGCFVSLPTGRSVFVGVAVDPAPVTNGCHPEAQPKRVAGRQEGNRSLKFKGSPKIPGMDGSVTNQTFQTELGLNRTDGQRARLPLALPIPHKLTGAE
jgi:hypothetical protein